MRVPCGVEFPGARGLCDLSLEQLRLYARRHAFAGITRVQSIDGAPVATRHHAVDWNFVGRMRPRPNKWRIEARQQQPRCDVWKEWGFARDEHGQHIYMERWERVKGGTGPYLALRRRPEASGGRDAFLIVCGDHFGYIEDRAAVARGDWGRHGSLVEVVDEAVKRGDRAAAEAYLDLKACHGVRREGGAWVIDYSLQPWLVGTALLHSSDLELSSGGKEFKWNGAIWAVLECTFTAEQLRCLTGRGRVAARL
eukprot:TRINITY_DN1365_c0_g1_i2.p1 TRINITY_DN1365_c0_g1~~TRINITY_DN1365_c0_g1_i2.p1  ORF type:complete len:253 (-),score=66.33 TRINITY_DN1365_c0_g1_i2:141-899(-)